jgi:hypothetical protein
MNEPEVEVVARALWEMNGSTPWAHASQGTKALRRKAARAAIAAALDAVRRSPQEKEWNRVEGASEEVYARSPQDEDHEAGIEAFLRRALAKTGWSDPMIQGLLADLQPYLSHCPSPERNTEKEN